MQKTLGLHSGGRRSPTALKQVTFRRAKFAVVGPRRQAAMAASGQRQRLPRLRDMSALPRSSVGVHRVL